MSWVISGIMSAEVGTAAGEIKGRSCCAGLSADGEGGSGSCGGKLTSGEEEGSISNWEEELLSTGSNGGVIVSAWRKGVPALLVEEKGVVGVWGVIIELIEKKWDGSSILPEEGERACEGGSVVVALAWAGKRFSSKTTCLER
jgi:hypothetical protein